MNKQIEEKDLIYIIDKFKKYTETAEQHEFPLLAMIGFAIQETNITEIVDDADIPIIEPICGAYLFNEYDTT